MLYRHLLNDALDKQRADFARYDRLWRDDVQAYVNRLHRLSAQTSREVQQKIAAYKEPGALPSAELDRASSMIVSFDHRWRSHEEARRWATAVLENRVTFAADGSQLLPGREVSLPVAAVQVAWFENPHTREGCYEKNARFRVVTPAELFAETDERSSAETIVGLRRFKLETEVLGEFLRKKKGWRARGERTPVAFFDGSLLISFGQPKTKIQGEYVSAVVELVKLSRDMEVPLIGFIDQSYARDLIALLNLLDGRERDARPASLTDAQLLQRALIENSSPNETVGNNMGGGAWGARSSFCYCKREKLSEAFSDEQGSPLLGFTYLQTTGDTAPARLDVPVWIYEAGLLEDVLDTVRAECVAGLGYPYAIETADAAAVITARDREQFLAAMQDFAARERFAFQVSRKAASKIRRR